MNISSSGETISVSELILKLCNHIGKQDQAAVPNLYKLAFNFLSSSSTTLATNSPSDEPFLIAQIKQILSSQSKEQVEKFDLLYTNICKSNILQQRPAILSFLVNLAKAQKDIPKWTVFHELDKFNTVTQHTRSRPLYPVSNATSQESIRNIFEARDTKKYNFTSVPSSCSRLQSQATTVSSAVWSRNDFIPLPSRTITISSASDHDLLQDVIYSLQGIEGKYLRKEAGGLGFTLDPKACKNLSPIQRGLVERLTGTSFLHSQLKQYCEDHDKQSGIICQALVATLRDELSNYYKTVALLQAGMKQQSCLEHSEMTLRRALFVTYDHHARFEWLAYIAEQCSDKKGGALITAIHGFLQHGSKCAQEVSEKVLRAVCKPLYIMLSRWLLDGEISDPYNEFFVEIRNITNAEQLWHHKYNVRQSMVPSFITMEQAKKILATGKSINFLRQICKDGGQLPGREYLQKLFKSVSADALFDPEQNLEFQETLENVYRETSLRVLDLLKNKYRLFEHLQSLRRYLLLGQGDFIRHLLELLAPELNKPANEIYGHTLTAILESAIRVTNAQYEDEDTLKRLNVSFLKHSINDIGWDVFSLVYIVDGPVGTIFQPTMADYQSLFGVLWKAKRMEFVLANMRRQQITISKLFRNIREMKPVTHDLHGITNEMIHFLHQTQYYFLFEVLECSWAELLSQVNKAECLDDIITAHTTFLNSVRCGVLLDDESRSFHNQLRSIYNLVLTLEGYQEALYVAASNEHKSYMAYRKKADRTDKLGITKEDETTAKRRVAEFQQFLTSIKKEVSYLAETYNLFVKAYLKLLSSSSNMNLQLLSVRLSFNDHYKIT